MKKGIVFLMCVLAMSAMAQQAELPCNGGTPITSHAATDAGCSPATANTAATCNEHTFCKSDKPMNWWSAFAWCESQGRKLTEFKTMCPGVSQTSSNTAGDCPNLQGKGDVWVWSSLAYFSDTALIVNLSSGAVFGFYARNDDKRHALCE